MRKRIYLYGDTSFGGAKYFAQQTGAMMKITGFSKKDSEKIIVEAQGEPEVLDKYIAKISKGNQFFKVERVETEDIDEVPGDKIFSIK